LTKVDTEINELIEYQITTATNHTEDQGYILGLEKAKDIIESATDINVATKTIGDKIRESNESLAKYISKFTILADRQRILSQLNQPYTEEPK